jgi:hypothetical protein
MASVRVLVLILTASSGFFTGCSSGVTRYAVTGTVVMDGQSLGLATLNFYPSDPAADSSNGGTARTDEAGKFTLGEDGKNTGLAAGDYKVTVTQTLIGGKASLGGSGGKKSEKVPGEKENIPDVYRSVQTTTLTAHVDKASRTITLELTNKKP